MTDQLTKRQNEVLTAIEEHVASRGYPPSLRELGDALGIGSTNGVRDHLIALEAKGFLKRDYATARGLKSTRSNKKMRAKTKTSIPLCGSCLAGSGAGSAIPIDGGNCSMCPGKADVLVDVAEINFKTLVASFKDGWRKENE